MEDIKSLPSSKGISRFSKRLFRTGKTLHSAFSIPSRIRILPFIAALTAAYQKICKIHKINLYELQT